MDARRKVIDWIDCCEAAQFAWLHVGVRLVMLCDENWKEEKRLSIQSIPGSSNSYDHTNTHEMYI